MGHKEPAIVETGYIVHKSVVTWLGTTFPIEMRLSTGGNQFEKLDLLVAMVHYQYLMATIGSGHQIDAVRTEFFRIWRDTSRVTPAWFHACPINLQWRALTIGNIQQRQRIGFVRHEGAHFTDQQKFTARHDG